MSRQLSERPDAWERRATIAVILVYIALAIGFSLGPILEAPDEPAHFRYIRGLIETRALPDPAAHANVQAHQAPLYYALLVPPTLLLDDGSEALKLPPQNPFWGEAFAATGNDNKNLRLHSQSEQFPYANNSLALTIHIVRLFSVLLGALTLIVSAQIFRLLWPQRADLRLLALGIIAFWPQFDWLSSVLNNDNLLILLSTVVLWLLLRQQRDGSSWPSAAVLGLALAAALLSKASALFLAIPVGVALLLDFKQAWRHAALTLAIVLALAGWWYVRNWLLVGNISGWDSAHDAGVILPGGAFAPLVALERLPFAYQGLWARFGNLSVPVGEPIYTFFDGLIFVSLVGLAILAIKRLVAASDTAPSQLRSQVSLPTPPLRQAERGTGGEANAARDSQSSIARQIAIVGSFILSWLIALIYLAGTAYVGNQGRYILPAIAGLAAMIALGVSAFIARPLRLHAASGGAAIMAAVSTISLFGFFYPAFRPLPAPSVIDHPLAYRFGDVAELVGVSPANPGGRPGDTITVTLYWKALKPSPASLITYFHSVDSVAVRRDSYPATGNLLATEWVAGQTWAERYVITLPPDAKTQTVDALTVGLYDAGTKQVLPAFDSAGNPVTPIVGRIAIHNPPSSFEPQYRFGGLIGMDAPIVTRQWANASAGPVEFEVCLRWIALARTPTDYHVFVHILAEPDQLIAQSDFEPKQARYPTSAWQPGEIVEDCVTLNVPYQQAASVIVATGMYDAATGDRLPVTDSAGRALDNAMIVIAP